MRLVWRTFSCSGCVSINFIIFFWTAIIILWALLYNVLLFFLFFFVFFGWFVCNGLVSVLCYHPYYFSLLIIPTLESCKKFTVILLFVHSPIIITSFIQGYVIFPCNYFIYVNLAIIFFVVSGCSVCL